MKPKKPNNDPDLFRSQLSQILNLSHPLCHLTDKINWDRLEADIEVVYGNGCGQSALPTRLLAGLRYLKYTFNVQLMSILFDHAQYISHFLSYCPDLSWGVLAQ